jgi:hypothetical protein
VERALRAIGAGLREILLVADFRTFETPSKSPFSKGGFRGIFHASWRVKAKSPLAPLYEGGRTDS